MICYTTWEIWSGLILVIFLYSAFAFTVGRDCGKAAERKARWKREDVAAAK